MMFCNKQPPGLWDGAVDTGIGPGDVSCGLFLQVLADGCVHVAQIGCRGHIVQDVVNDGIDIDLVLGRCFGLGSSLNIHVDHHGGVTDIHDTVVVYIKLGHHRGFGSITAV